MSGSGRRDRETVYRALSLTPFPMRLGFMYLVAILDWYSRYVLAWSLSNTMETAFCLEALSEALSIKQPEIFNTDQGSQYTSMEFTGMLSAHGVAISMDGRGRVFDNILVERLWRSVKYELIYLHDFTDGQELYEALKTYFHFYNRSRPHQALAYQTPSAVYQLSAT